MINGTATGQPNDHQAAGQPPRWRKALRRGGIAFGVAIAIAATSGCTPEQVAFFQSVTEPYAHVLSDAQLESLRTCESGGNYAIVDRSGTFRGAYQFTRGTWDGVASRHFPFLVGVDPAEADPWWQDVMARALYEERGSQPWPICGRQL